MKKCATPGRKEIDELFGGTRWHQRWEAFEGVFTPGTNDIAFLCDALGLPEDLSGKRVLDIGAWNGCLSFECERRGAAAVLALGPEAPENTGFHKLKKAIGATRTEYRVGSVYNLDPREIGVFDIVVFCGVLYHLRYPMLGIDNIRRICKGEVYVETDVLDGANRFGRLNPLSPVLSLLRKRPTWHFHRLNELNGDYSNWFSPTIEAVIQAFTSAGFELECTRSWPRLRPIRAAFHGKAKPGVPEFLGIPSGEGVYYRTLVSNLFAGTSGPADFAP